MKRTLRGVKRGGRALRSRLNTDGMRLVDAKVSSLQVSPTRCKFAPPAYHARLPHRTAPPAWRS